MSENSSDFRLFVDMENGDKCSPGNAKPAAAAACRDCRRAAECSWALRRSSATELERGSVELAQFEGARMEDTAEGADDDGEAATTEVGGELVGLIGQQEQARPEKAGKSNIYSTKCAEGTGIVNAYLWGWETKAGQTAN